MDANKLKRLKEVGYVFYPTCGRCIHARIEPQNYWGTCKRHLYFHFKHKEAREMSINKSGGCDFFKKEENPSIEDYEGRIND
jgi:hypothetical protein